MAVYLPLNTPHSPMQVPDRYYDPFARRELSLKATDTAKEDPAFTKAALAMVENIDANVGRVLKSLDELGLAENTIVLYFSDNGPNSHRWNGGMRGVKGTTDEGGVRSPLLMRWKGKIPAGGFVSRISGAIDLLPTLADLAGVTFSSQKALDGKSLRPLLFEEKTPWEERLLFSLWAGKVTVRSDRFRLDASGRLYDPVVDPGQTTDLTKDFPQDAERLKNAVGVWKKEVLPGIEDKERPYPVGYADFPVTSLPARDGIGHGQVQRSAKAPNCSYFKNWVSKEDRITWDVQVATDGFYDVVVYYTCPAADIGSKVEVRLGEGVVTAKVEQPNDPPEKGAENDRTPRHGESYVKDFKPLRIGKMQVKSGHGLLSLRALEIPGKQVMEVESIELTLLKP